MSAFELSGGSSSLPSWWTVDSTPGSESLTLDGELRVGTVLQERFYDAAVDQQTLPWTHASGDALLDFTDPLNPTVIESGTYIASLAARMNVASGTYMILDVELDAAGEDYDQRSGAPIVPNLAISSAVGVSICAVLEAGNDLLANVYHDAPGGTNVSFLGQIVKLL